MVCRPSRFIYALVACSGMLVARADTPGSLHGRVNLKGAGPLAGAEVTLTARETGLTATARTGARGDFSFAGLAPGTYVVVVRHPRLKTAGEAVLKVEAGKAAAASLTLDPLEARATVAVTGFLEEVAVPGSELESRRVSSSDTAALLQDLPGVHVMGAGGVSSLPSVHGLADDRLRVKVDGMDLVAACPNHMNPPLSYLDPASIGAVKVYAGVTPVSVGGDSIGGTVILESRQPAFAAPGQGQRLQGEAGAFHRSNGEGKGAHLSVAFATESFSITYAGSTSQSGDYKAGGSFRSFTATGNPGVDLAPDVVGSSAYLARNQSFGLALRGGRDTVGLTFGWQDIPYQYYPNQRMDLLGNTEHRANLSYQGQRDWGTLEARVYRETVDHYMNFGADKMFWYGNPATVPGMPMTTGSFNTGATLKASLDLGEGDVFRLGGEFQHFRLDDSWAPSGGGMAPYTFLNLDNGRRDRAALYGEWGAHAGGSWTTLLGLRYEQVRMDADPVHGYNLAGFPTVPTPAGAMNQTRDAANFNNADRSKVDHNLDLALSAHCTPDPTHDYEIGLARKVRSPNLYERYSWSRANMMAVMNNFTGDGNGYIGDPALKPEVAYTLSITGDWHSADRRSQLKVTPFCTRVADYIDATPWNGATDQPLSPLVANQFVALRFVNQEARIWGVDLSGQVALGGTPWGEWGLKGLLSSTRGTNPTSGYGLYDMMPFNAKVILTQEWGGWSGALETQWVDAKTRVSVPRNEVRTGGYTLFHLRCAYLWNQVRFDLAVENLLDKLYASPLGGAYVGQGRTMGINSIPWGIAVPGMGRSINAAVTVKF